MQNKKVVLFSIIGLVLVFIGAFYAYNKSEESKYAAMAKEKAVVYERPYSLSVGPADAKVTLVEFFDPACGTCAQFHPIVKDLLKEHKGNLRVVYRYAAFHENSSYAVKMLEGARAQDKFEETLSYMYKTRQYWINGHTVNVQMLWRMLARTKLDMQALSTYIQDPKLDDLLKQEAADAEELGATKTPSFYVNGKPLVNFGEQNLRDLINSQM